MREPEHNSNGTNAMRLLAVFLTIALTVAQASAQVPNFPQTIPANSVVGRLGLGAGPTQAIPFTTLATQLSTLIGPSNIGPSDVYVNPSTGADTGNDCTSAAAPCATIQNALNNIIGTRVYNLTSPTIHLADGTYNEQVTCTAPAIGATAINITGNNNTPTNVVWVPQAFTPPSGGYALKVNNLCSINLSGISFQDSATACSQLIAFNGSISVNHIQFGALTISSGTGCGYHILVDNNGIYTVLGNDYTISGSMTYHVLLVGPAKMQLVNTEMYLPSALTFSNFYSVSGPASINYDSTVVCKDHAGGTAGGGGCAAHSTGSKFSLIGNGNLSSNSSVIPGATAGVLAGGGCADLVCASGAVAAGSDTQVQYNSAGSFAGSAGFTFDGTSKISLGVSGASVGKTSFTNATSGTVTVQPVTGALGSSVLSFPAATDTLVGKATTDALTNKTLNTAATGNVFQINGTTVSTVVPVGVGGTGVAGVATFLGASTASVNFNSGNTDTAITITLPAGYTRFRMQSATITGASASLTTATAGLFTGAGGTGTAIVTGGSAITVNTGSDNTNNNLQALTIANTLTETYNVGTLYFRVGTAQGSAATATVTIWYIPVL